MDNILVGHNAKDNWKIIDLSSENDIWFHLTDYPSSHVIFHQNDTNKINKKIIKKCATIVKQNSKQKYNNKKISVDYTPVKNIIKSKPIGTIIFVNEDLVKTILV